jgi:nucleoside-diphosphate-sugar epimerase
MRDLHVVCGGRGFVGQALIADLKQKGHEVKCVSRGLGQNNCGWSSEPWEIRDGVEYVNADLMKPDHAVGVVRDARYVYNLAASVGGIDFIQNNRAACMSSALINLNLLRACHQFGTQRYFFASSACVYSSRDFPITESCAEPATPERGYGWEKLFGEQVCREYREAGFVDTRAARYFTLYGPGDDKKHNHFPAELCKKIATAKILAHKSIELWGDGSQVRSLLYIDDCVEGTQRIMDSGVTIPLNLSGAEYASTNQMADLVQSIAGTDLQVNYVPGVTGVQSRFASNERIHRELDWEPSTGLKEGFEWTYRWWFDKLLKELR